MPKSTFLNLDSKKQTIIMNAAKEEFTNNLLEQASINQIIKKSEISRGSFYTYFEDINDIYSYMLENHKKRTIKQLKILIKKNKGDVRETFINLFDLAIKASNSGKGSQLFKNIFMNFHISNPAFFSNKKEGKKQIIKDVYDAFKEYNDYEYLEELLEIATIITMHSITFCILKEVPNDIVRKKYITQINIIIRGSEIK